MKPNWKGNKEYLLARLIRLMEEFVASGRIDITPPLFNQDDLRRRLVITLNLGKVVQHMWESISSDNTELDCAPPTGDFSSRIEGGAIGSFCC